MTDTIIIGYNNPNLDEEVALIKSMGADSVAYKDFRMGIVNTDGKHQCALDLLTYFYTKSKPYEKVRPFHNTDVLWQCVSYLVSYLTKKNINVQYVNIFHMEKERLAELVKKQTRTVAITTTIYMNINPIIEVVQYIRSLDENVKIIIGGPLINRLFEELEKQSLIQVLQMMGGDYYIDSLEGEATLTTLIQAIKTDESSFEEVPNIAFYKQGQLSFTHKELESNSLEENFIDYSLFSKEDIGHTANIRTSKGCPFHCSYCGFPLRTKKYQYLDVSYVERELDLLAQHSDVEHICFIDDTFNVPRTRFKEILKMMIRKKYRYKWYGFYRCDFGDEEIISLMKESGCIGVFIGVESANNDILTLMNKTARVENYMETIPLLKRYGIHVFASTIIGFPGETYATAKETFDFIEEYKPDFFRPQIWWADKLTPIWKRREEFGVIGFGFNWRHNTMDAQTAYSIMEEQFFAVKNSIWVPEPGFNVNSIFYLMQRGMPYKVIQDFLHCYNALVKQQILFSERDLNKSELIESMEDICAFDTRTHKAFHASELFTPDAYIKTRKYWRAKLEYNMGACEDKNITPRYENLKTMTYTYHGDAHKPETSIIMTAFIKALLPSHNGKALRILYVNKDNMAIPIFIKTNDKEDLFHTVNKTVRNIKETWHLNYLAINHIAKNELGAKLNDCYVYREQTKEIEMTSFETGQRTQGCLYLNSHIEDRTLSLTIGFDVNVISKEQAEVYKGLLREALIDITKEYGIELNKTQDNLRLNEFSIDEMFTF